MVSNGGVGDGLTRRSFLQASLAAGAMASLPVRKLRLGEPGAGSAPPGFPSHVRLYRQAYENWSGDVKVDAVWSAEAMSYADAVAVANWAKAHGWRVRPSGMRHNWAPYNVVPGQSADAEVVLVDMRALNRISVDAKAKTVFAQAGALMDDVMSALQAKGLGFSSIPAPGSVTVGGVLAINGHGAAVPANGEDPTGHSFGSMSNRVISMRAIVWDAPTDKFVERTFDRSNPITKAMLTSFGRVFVLSVLLRAEKALHLRCVSDTSIDASELFAPQGAKGRTFASYVDKTGRVEAILFPYTDKPWLKYWEVAPTKPKTSRAVSQPYNYPFSDVIPKPVSRLAHAIVTGDDAVGPEFGAASYAATEYGLIATDSIDIWGPALTVQHYIRASTLRATALSHAVLTSRATIQRVVHEWYAKYRALAAAYRARGLYPANMPIEIRVTGVDDPTFVGVPGAEAPTFSSMTPRADHPEWDTVVFLSALALVDTPGLGPFMRDMEQWLFANYVGDYATARVEWSKAWACTAEGAWQSEHVLREIIPSGFRAGRTAENNWDWAVARLNELDPHRVFTNDFVDAFLR